MDIWFYITWLGSIIGFIVLITAIFLLWVNSRKYKVYKKYTADLKQYRYYSNIYQNQIQREQKNVKKETRRKSTAG